MTDAPIIYVYPRTRAATALWMNEEVGAPCRIEVVDLKTGQQKAAPYLAVNPMGKTPALVDRGVAVTETAAICAYLADAYPSFGLAPALSDPRRGLYYRWMFFAPSCIEPAMMDKFAGREPANPEAAGHGRMADVLRAIDVALGEGPFLLGDVFSAADVVFGSTLRFALLFGAIEETPAHAAYIERVTARDAFKRAGAREAALQAALDGGA